MGYDTLHEAPVSDAAKSLPSHEQQRVGRGMDAGGAPRRYVEAARCCVFRGVHPWQPRRRLGRLVHGTSTITAYAHHDYCRRIYACPQYTEFTAYAALLSGAPPTVLQRSLVAHHPHLWKLREHHLYAPDEPGTTSDVWPVSPGNPLRGYIPNGSQVRETSEGLEIKEPGQVDAVLYRSWSSLQTEDKKPKGKLVDIFVTGEVSLPHWHVRCLRSDLMADCYRATPHGASSTSSVV